MARFPLSPSRDGVRQYQTLQNPNSCRSQISSRRTIFRRTNLKTLCHAFTRSLAALVLLASCQSVFAQTYAIQDLGTLGRNASYSTAINARGQVTGWTITLTNAAHAFLYSDTQLMDLGALDGRFSFGKAINSGGQVTGYAHTAGARHHAFLFNGAQLVDLGTLGGAESDGTAINDSGQVTGSAQIWDGNRHAFLFDGTRMADLGTLGGARSEGLAINARGQVTGWAETADGHAHAFLFDGTRMIDLGTLGGAESGGKAINAGGQVTGWADTILGGRHAFLYSDSRMADLGTLGGSASVGEAINAAGQVTGSAEIAPDISHAFFFDGARMADLGTLGGRNSIAHAINTGGQVVGEADTTAFGQPHAFVSTLGRVRDLNALLPADSGWELFGAAAVNDRGQITGYGNHVINGANFQRAFLLTPVAVPPSDFALSLTAARVTGGDTPIATITLTAPAPTGGAVFAITSNTGAALIPAKVTVPEGQTQAVFRVTTTPVAFPITSTIRAAYNGVTRYANLVTTPPILKWLTASPPTVKGGSATTGTVALTGPAPSGGVTVYLYSNTAAALVPATVTIPAGARGHTFTIKTNKVVATVTTTLKASYRTASVYAFLTVTR